VDLASLNKKLAVIQSNQPVDGNAITVMNFFSSKRLLKIIDDDKRYSFRNPADPAGYRKSLFQINS
jgi:hypothetical protein